MRRGLPDAAPFVVTSERIDAKSASGIRHDPARCPGPPCLMFLKAERPLPDYDLPPLSASTPTSQQGSLTRCMDVTRPAKTTRGSGKGKALKTIYHYCSNRFRKCSRNTTTCLISRYYGSLIKLKKKCKSFNKIPYIFTSKQESDTDLPYPLSHLGLVFCLSDPQCSYYKWTWTDTSFRCALRFRFRVEVASDALCHGIRMEQYRSVLLGKRSSQGSQ